MHHYTVTVSAAVLLILLSLCGCTGRNNTAASFDTPVIAEEPALNAADIAMRENASRIAAALDDRQLAAQVIITGIDGKGQLTYAMRTLLDECPAGGVMLFRYNLDTPGSEIRNLIRESSQLVRRGTSVESEDSGKISIAPFVAADHEGGPVNRFLPGTADLPPAVSYREMTHNKSHEIAVTAIYTDSINAGRKINDLGVNLNFAPVAEYLNDDNRGFLENRSYGSDPVFTAKAAAAFIMGMEQAGVLCAAKHFPGSTGEDPHLHPSVLRGDRTVLAEINAPFAALIRDGHARALMVSHSSVPAFDSENIASLSPAVMGGWLRHELGFEGIIICDDFSMAAAGANARPELLAVKSLAAGSCMVLVWPPDLRRTHREILAALDDGRISREKLRDAAQRIIYEKLGMGLISGE